MNTPPRDGNLHFSAGALERAQRGILKLRNQRLAYLALARGWITSDQLRECEGELDREQNRESRLLIGDLLLTRGWLNVDRVRELWQQLDAWDSKKPPSASPAESRRMATEHVVPPDVQEASQDPANLFDKYVKLALLGQGGVGSVWKCYDRNLGRYVAVKFLDAAGPSTAQRFLREATIAAKLDHPNIARVYETGNSNGIPYIAMQYVPGATLQDRALPVSEAIDLMTKVARAIHFAHEQGVIHRDLKPENIILSPAGQACVLDFSLAKELESGLQVSVTGSVMGTPPFMSPEQARGEIHRVDARTDVYGLGATLYALVTGLVPFPGDHLGEVLFRVQHEEPSRPRSIRREIPRDLETIILKAMEKDASRRYQSAREVADDLERHSRSEPILARRSSVLYRLQKTVQKQPRVCAAVVLGFLGALLFGTFYLGRHLQSREELGRLIDEGDRKLAACDLQGAMDLAGRAREIDPEKAEPLWRRIQQLQADADRDRLRLQTRQEEREALEPLLRKLWSIDLASATGPAKDHGPDLEEIAVQGRLQSQQHPDWAGPWLVTGWAKRIQYKYQNRETIADEAEKDLDNAVRLGDQAHRMDAMFQRALLFAERVRERMGDYTGSNFSGRWKWSRKGVLDARAKEWIGRALDDLKACESHSLNVSGRIFAQAILEFIQEDFAAAAKRLESARLGTIDALVLTAQCYFFGEGRAWSLDEVERVALATRRKDALVLSARMLHVERKLDRAERAMTILVYLFPQEAALWCNRGVVWSQQDRFAEAISDFSKALELNPRLAVAYFGRGQALRFSGDMSRALEDLSRGIELQPDYWPAYEGRGRIHFEQGEFLKAISDLDAAIRLAPGEAYLLILRGLAKSSAGDNKAAIQDYSSAIRIDPKNRIAFNNRGLARFAEGDFQGSILDFSEAIELDPQYAQAYSNRAGAYARLLQAEKAIVDFNRALELSPGDLNALMNRALVYEWLGTRDKVRAVEYWVKAQSDIENALKSPPSNWKLRAVAEEALDRVRKQIAKAKQDY